MWIFTWCLFVLFLVSFTFSSWNFPSSGYVTGWILIRHKGIGIVFSKKLEHSKIWIMSVVKLILYIAYATVDIYKNHSFRQREREREMMMMMMMMMMYNATYSACIQIIYMWLYWVKFHSFQFKISLRWFNHWCLSAWGFNTTPPPPTPI